MEFAVGAVLEGKVTGITKFGAFVALEGGNWHHLFKVVLGGEGRKAHVAAGDVCYALGGLLDFQARKGLLPACPPGMARGRKALCVAAVEACGGIVEYEGG